MNQSFETPPEAWNAKLQLIFSVKCSDQSSADFSINKTGYLPGEHLCGHRDSLSYLCLCSKCVVVFFSLWDYVFVCKKGFESIYQEFIFFIKCNPVLITIFFIPQACTFVYFAAVIPQCWNRHPPEF